MQDKTLATKLDTLNFNTVDSDGFSALLYACRNDRKKVIDLMLDL